MTRYNEPNTIPKKFKEIEKRLDTVERSVVGPQFLTEKSGMRSPSAPQNLSVTSSARVTETGETVASLEASWDAVTGSAFGTTLEISHYELWGKPNTQYGLWRRLTAAPETSGEFEPLPAGETWVVRVRAIARSSTSPGEYSNEVVITLAGDTTPPPVPSKPILTTNLGIINVQWDGLPNMPADFSHVEVAMGPAANPTTVVGRLGGRGSLPIGGQPYDVPRHFRFRAVDRSGNESAWSAGDSISAKPLVDADLINTTIKDAVDDAVERMDTIEGTLTGVEDSVSDAAAAAAQAQIDADLAAQAASTALRGVNLINNTSRTGTVDRWSKSLSSTNLSAATVDFMGKPVTAMEYDATGNPQIYSDYFDVDVSKAYEVRFWVLDPTSTSGTQFYFGMNVRKGGSTTVARAINRTTGSLASESNNIYFYSTPSNHPEWTEYVAYFLPYGTDPSETVGLGKGVTSNVVFTDPATTQARIRFLNYSNGTNRRSLWLAHMTVTETSFEAVRLAKVAQDSASSAHTALGTITQNVSALTTSVNGKNSITWSTSAPAGTGRTSGDIHYQYRVVEGVTRILGMWQWGGSPATWQSRQLDETILPKVDIGVGTYGELDGIRLLANSVLADRVVVGNAENLIPNGSGEAGSAIGWGNLTYDTVDKPDGIEGSFRSSVGQGTLRPSDAQFFSVQPNTQYLFEVWLKADKPNSRFYFEFRDQNGNLQPGNSGGLSPSGSSSNYAIENMTLPTTWTKYYGVITTREDASKVQVAGLYFNHSAGSEQNAQVWIAGAALRPRVRGILLEDDTITTPKLVVDNELWARLASFVTIKADQLDANEIWANETWTGRARINLLTVGAITPDMQATGGDELVVNPTFSNDALWDKAPLLNVGPGIQASSSASHTDPASPRGAWFATPSTTDSSVPLTLPVPVAGGDRFSLWMYANRYSTAGDKVLRMEAEWLDRDQNRISGDGPEVTGDAPTAYQTYEKVVVAPPTATFMRVHLTVVSGTTGQYIVQKVSVRRAFSSTFSDWTTQITGRGLETFTPEGHPSIQLGAFDETGMTLYKNGEAQVTVNDSGEIGGSIIHANESLTYRGEELADILDAGPRGVVARTTAQATRGPYGVRVGIFRLSFRAVPGRMYRFNLFARARNATGRGVDIQTLVRTNMTGTAYPSATLSSSLTDALDELVIPSAAISDTWYMSGSIHQIWFTPESDREYIPTTVIIAMDSIDGDRALTWQGGHMVIEDIGSLDGYDSEASYTLAGSSGAAPPNQTTPPPPDSEPVPKSYTRTYGYSWHRTWEQDGDYPSAAQDACYQGKTPYYPSAGIYRSMVGVSSMTSNLSGATISRIRVRVRMTHSHSGSGGTVVIGTHSNSSRPSSFTNTNSGIVSSKFSRGQEKWITLPSSTHSGFRSGSRRGIIFYINSTNTAYYCKMSPSRTAIEVKYTK